VTFRWQRVFGALLLLKLLGSENNIYAQVAGYADWFVGKHAVLIVELLCKSTGRLFSIKAAIEGSVVRFRPILMTSFAFIAGLIPLVFANGPEKLVTYDWFCRQEDVTGKYRGVYSGLYYLFGKQNETFS
jgi:HAE1 family hydrophobic/amphiphilic exporter-1